MVGMSKSSASKKRKAAHTNGRAKKSAKVLRYTTPRRGILSTSLSKRLQFPSVTKHRTTLRYFGNFISVNPAAAGVADSHIFSANGLYDPDITGTGHQPIGFDQLMVIYDHYTVLGAKITVYGNSTDTSNPMFLYCAVRDSQSASTDTREIVENGYVDIATMDIASNASRAKVSQYVDVAKFLGRKDAMSDDILRGTSSANPTEQVHFHCGAFTVNQVDGSAVNLNVIIDYDVVFHERTVLAPS